MNMQATLAYLEVYLPGHFPGSSGMHGAVSFLGNEHCILWPSSFADWAYLPVVYSRGNLHGHQLPRKQRPRRDLLHRKFWGV